MGLLLNLEGILEKISSTKINTKIQILQLPVFCYSRQQQLLISHGKTWYIWQKSQLFTDHPLHKTCLNPEIPKVPPSLLTKLQNPTVNSTINNMNLEDISKKTCILKMEEYFHTVIKYFLNIHGKAFTSNISVTMCCEVLAYINKQHHNTINTMGACILCYTVLTKCF